MNPRIRVGLGGTQGLEYVYDRDPDHPEDPEEIKKRAIMDWIKYGPTRAMRGGIALPPPYTVDVGDIKTANGDPARFAELLAEWEQKNEG